MLMPKQILSTFNLIDNLKDDPCKVYSVWELIFSRQLDYNDHIVVSILAEIEACVLVSIGFYFTEDKIYWIT